MKEHEKFTFEEIFKQNERRIYYQLHRLGIHDPDGEFYSEGMEAMWRAYQRYQPNKGPLSTYFNFIIRNRMIDLVRKKVKEQDNEKAILEQYSSSAKNPQRIAQSGIASTSDIPITDEKLWQTVFSTLTEKQRKWVYYAIIHEYTLREIAEKEDVSVEAVKSWGKEARRKLRGLWERDDFGREDMLDRDFKK